MEINTETEIKVKGPKMSCECGGCYFKIDFFNKLKHFKSNKHQKFVTGSNINDYRTDCECGGTYTVSGISHHKNTKMHQNYMNTIVTCDCGVKVKNSDLYYHSKDSKRHQKFVKCIEIKNPPIVTSSPKKSFINFQTDTALQCIDYNNTRKNVM